MYAIKMLLAPDYLEKCRQESESKGCNFIEPDSSLKYLLPTSEYFEKGIDACGPVRGFRSVADCKEGFEVWLAYWDADFLAKHVFSLVKILTQEEELEGFDLDGGDWHSITEKLPA